MSKRIKLTMFLTVIVVVLLYVYIFLDFLENENRKRIEYNTQVDSICNENAKEEEIYRNNFYKEQDSLYKIIGKEVRHTDSLARLNKIEAFNVNDETKTVLIYRHKIKSLTRKGIIWQYDGRYYFSKIKP